MAGEWGGGEGDGRRGKKGGSSGKGRGGVGLGEGIVGEEGRGGRVEAEGEGG